MVRAAKRHRTVSFLLHGRDDDAGPHLNNVRCESVKDAVEAAHAYHNAVGMYDPIDASDVQVELDLHGDIGRTRAASM